MVAIYLTHDRESRTNYYGDRALAGLAELGELRVNDTVCPLTTAQLIAEAEKDPFPETANRCRSSRCLCLRLRHARAWRPNW